MYSYVNPDRTVGILNDLKARVLSGEQIFYDIYTEEEKSKRSSKLNALAKFGAGCHSSAVRGSIPANSRAVGLSYISTWQRIEKYRESLDGWHEAARTGGYCDEEIF